MREWREKEREAEGEGGREKEREGELLEHVSALNSGSKVPYLLSSQGFLLGDPYQSL